MRDLWTRTCCDVWADDQMMCYMTVHDINTSIGNRLFYFQIKYHAAIKRNTEVKNVPSVFILSLYMYTSRCSLACLR